jgi:hypothetical protein
MMGFNHPTNKRTTRTLILTSKFEKLIFDEKRITTKIPQKIVRTLTCVHTNFFCPRMIRHSHEN